VANSPSWLAPDKIKILDHARKTGIRVTKYIVNPYREVEDGYYCKHDKIVVINSELEKSKPSHYISVLLHEMGHHYDYAFRGGMWKTGEENSEMLVEEHMAGIYGLYLAKSLCIEMPVRLYTRTNNGNLKTYYQDLQDKVGDDSLDDAVIAALEKVSGFIFSTETKLRLVDIPQSYYSRPEL